MASPVGHLIAGYAVYAARQQQVVQKRHLVLAIALFSALAPDLDFLPGLLIGEPGRFHHAASHSLGAAVLYGMGIWGYL